MSSKQLSEWMAFFQLEPFGFQASLYGDAVTSSVIANANRRKGTKVFKPEDFIPQERKSETQGSFFDNLKRLFNIDKRKKK